MNATLPAKLSALPDRWISKVFATMSAAYGTLFTDRWKDSDLNEVKQIWAQKLATFSDSPETFSKALAAMIDECKFPPTLPEFVAICRRHYKRPEPVMLCHTLSQEEIESNRARIRMICEGFK